MQSSSIFVTSDWHLNHRKMLKGEFGIRPSNYETLLVKNYREVVSEVDTVVFLGDMLFQPATYRKEFAFLMQSLPGTKLLVKGNHDAKLYRDYIIKDCGFTACYDDFFIYGEILFSHHPVYGDTRKKYKAKSLALRNIFEGKNLSINLHGHMHEYPVEDARCVSACPEFTNYYPLRIDLPF